MSKKQVRLMQKARKKYGVIYPCGHNHEWRKCFSVHDNRLLFWFNTADDSTHLEAEDFDQRRAMRKAV